MPDTPVLTAPTWRERLRARVAPRAVGIAATLLIEALLLILLLSLNQVSGPHKARETVVAFTAHPASEDRPPEPEPAASPQPPAEPRPAVRPPPPQAVPQPPIEAPPAPPPVPVPHALTTPAPPPAARPAPAAPADQPAYGPPDTGGGNRGAYGDTPRVGTAPNGEPMYAAAWYTRPTDSQLRGYLSTASGPGWALVACKTVPDFRVEDCVGLDEYPAGSQILRAVLAAAWQFRVRPPRRGGEALVGSWVRIRIDYDIRRE